MSDWNVVVTIAEGRYRQALDLLARHGQVWRSDFYNVLTLKTDDVTGFLEGLRQAWQDDPHLAGLIGKAIPASQAFTFQSPEEFQTKAREIMAGLAPQVAGRGFHVRMHRRGFKGRLSTMEVEQLLDGLLMELTEQMGRPARVTFSDPQVVVAVETVGTRAGVSAWEKEERRKYPFLRLD
ncbi:MAG: hypothetical protein HY910_02175 [Desulfarculus sp.]|nr:hypothetical protein [Desulfarculus sp.]